LTRILKDALECSPGEVISLEIDQIFQCLRDFPTDQVNVILRVEWKCLILKGSPGTTVKLFPCDHEVMGSSPRNSLLQKCRERLCT
jgi:hypothetical protein